MPILFPTGILITQVEHKALLHVIADPEVWLANTVAEKAQLRGDVLINEWRPRLFADPTVEELPAAREALLALILARSDYQNRLQRDAAQVPPEIVNQNNTNRYAAKKRLHRGGVVLFPAGVDVPDLNLACILSYIQDIEDWILGALLGQINRGKKKMIAQYHPIIMADPSVTTMPATEDGLITMILARPDYQRLGG